MKLIKGWKLESVGELFEVQLGKMINAKARSGDHQLPYMTNCNVQWGRIKLTDIRKMYFSEKDKEKFRLKSGDLLVCEGGEVGRCAIWRNQLEECYYQKALHRLRPKSDQVLNTFTYYFLEFASGSRLISNSTSRSSIAHLTREKFTQILIPLPTLPEQQKIAEILGTCDEAIEAQERLIAKKQQLKKGLMQKLLTGEVRFPEFERTPWRSVKASELFTTRSEKNTNEEPVLSVTQDVGILLRSSVERRISGASKNFPNYKMVYPRDFVISLRSFQGGLEYSQIKGAVSPAYHVIHKKRELCEEFYRHFFKSWEFIGRLKTATIGIRDGKQIAFRDFSFMRLPAPAIAEQQAISGLLCEYDKEITLQQNKLEQLKQQKRSLMQQLLTGKVRVKI